LRTCLGGRERGARADDVVDTGSVMTKRPSDACESVTAACAEWNRAGVGRTASWLRISLVCLVLSAAACTTGRPSLVGGSVTPDELLAGAALGAAVDAPALVTPEQDVLALNPAMLAFLDEHVDRKGSDEVKMTQLISAIMDTRSFGVTYDNSTHTAAETFRTRRGNCLSFSNMFVAMARNVGLDVRFQEVDVPPDWTLEKDTYVLNQHVDVRVNVAQVGTRVVDFNIADFRASYEMRVISDARALAHYYNNIGVERMLEGDTGAALACFRKAITEDTPQFSPAWTNLGTLYVRNGHPAHGEAAFLQALEVDGGDLVAMSDLARLYDRIGRRDLAAAYRKKVIHHRWLNPYYRYELARQAYAAKHYRVAIGHLRYAAHRRPKEDQFSYLLGVSYLQEGKVEKARRWLTKAEEVAPTEALKQKYAAEVEKLVPGVGTPR
jgi:Flp pilus assembly protein TadD